jgi:hypothetical protein
MKWLTAVCTFLTVVAFATRAPAGVNVSVGFGDTERYWLNNGNKYSQTGTYNPNPSSYDNQDTIGIPNFAPATQIWLNSISYNGLTGVLESVQFKYTNSDTLNPGWKNGVHGVMLPGDLLLDLDNDNVWDYAVRTKYNGQSYTDAQVNYPSGDLATWNVYKLNNTSGIWNYANTSAPYLWSMDQNSGGVRGESDFDNSPDRTWERDGDSWGVGVRQHPWRILDSVFNTDAVKLLGTAGFDGWKDHGTGAAPAETTFTFDNSSGGLIDLGTPGVDTVHLRIGFTTNCANDIVWETLDHKLVLVPEPASLAIWALAGGLGAAGLAFKRRRPRWSKENRQAIVGLIGKGVRG